MNDTQKENFLYVFIGDIEFDDLKKWADVLYVDYEEPPIDDMYPDWEGELRTELMGAMCEIFVAPPTYCSLTAKADLFDELVKVIVPRLLEAYYHMAKTINSQEEFIGDQLTQRARELLTKAKEIDK